VIRQDERRLLRHANDKGCVTGRGPYGVEHRRRTAIGLATLVIGLLACLRPCSARTHPDVSMPFLLIWPSTRATALAGTMTGLADDAEAAYWNLGGLAFQKGLRGDGTWYSWRPDIMLGMHYSYASLGYGLPALGRRDAGLNIGVSATYFSIGHIKVVNHRGDLLGWYESYRLATGPHCSIRIADQLGIGLGVKLVKSVYGLGLDIPLLWWAGIDRGGSGATVAADIGALYRPAKAVSVGLVLANLGPRISYTSSGESDALPSVLRLGACAAAVDGSLLHINVLAQLDKPLAGTGLVELDGARAALGVEAAMLRIVTLGCGYSVSPNEELSGFCWGVGLGWKYAGMQFAMDGLTHTWRLAARGPWLTQPTSPGGYGVPED